MRHAWYRLVGWFGTVITTRWLHAPLYRWTGGWGPLGRSLGMLTVILVTTGARTGRRRESAIWAHPDGDDLVLVASNGGRPRIPGWCWNLRAHPDGEVLVFRDRRAVRAREAAGDEYMRIWALVATAYPGYLDYRERWAGRRIPLVILSPRPDLGPRTESA